ncbi:hypothetical protein CYMTET_29341 [Cymbomonas tetramitiformis]|uniref:DUF7869 domain-containing protein n=1 Tax=Cymbomonas tetramitiformis TaxID=36881 RepID=A0AAE0FLL6_9CHLO|nr:hypothetical protein CYMTET_29341 [Cymbomonas tetramitiformis]
MKLNYLIVGHTHENIDQMFSRFSVALRRINVFDIEHLMEVARSCFKDGVSPECQLIDEVHDIKSWMSGCYNKIRDVSYQHAFKIIRAEDGQVIGQGKLYSFDPTWLPKKDLATTEDEKKLEIQAQRASKFLQDYAKMQRDIAEGTFQLAKKVAWVTPEAPFHAIDNDQVPLTTPTQRRNIESDISVNEEIEATIDVNQRNYSAAQMNDYVQGLRDSVASHVRPVPRPIYTGAQKSTAGRRARDHLARYILGESDDPDYDVGYNKMKKGSMAVLIAPESEKTSRTDYPFRISLGRSRGWPRYLYLCEVQEQLLNEEGEKCLRWLTCGTNKLTQGQKDSQNADSQ